ncbi:MAG TPA: phosphatidylserine decarboxylase [Woeseiaceae bacterium]|nr:phosphatidylserine decarboxylase [Woeseiaceae bacterium]
MIDRKKSIIAGEGAPFLLALAACAALLWRVAGPWQSLPVLGLLVLAALLFRDPRRPVPPAPRAIVSPVDGRVVTAGEASRGTLDGPVRRIVIRVNPFGTYTARAPVEGKVMDLQAAHDRRPRGKAGGLWLRTDEEHDVVLRFSGRRFGLVPAAIVRYGSRLGQGQRCAYLRWTRFAELELPEAARVLVAEGERVTAGSDVLAELPHSDG